MADQVTVSTFLELKDNMSKGLQHLSKMLHELTATANQANDAMNRLAAATNKIGKGASASAKTAATALNAQARQVERNSARQTRLDEMLARRQQARIESAARRQARIDEATARRQQRYDAAAARRLDRALTRAARAPSRAPARDDSTWRVLLGQQGTAGRMLASIGTKAFAPNLGLFAIEAIGSAISTATDLVKQFTKEVLEASHNFEQMTFRIGLSLSSFGLSPSTQVAINTAGALYDKMRMLAAKLPGEAKDYVQVFSQSLPDALAAGEKNLDRYAQFISKFTAFGISRGVPHIQQIATDLQQMLQGRVQIRTRTFQELRAFIGESHKDFNKITSTAKRLEVIMKATEKASKGMSLAAETMDAKYGELKSHIEAILVEGGKPMFTAAKDAISIINAYLRDNYDLIVNMVQVVSTDLVDAFFAVAQTLGDIYNKFADIKRSISDMIDEYSAVFSPTKFAQGLFGSPDTIKDELRFQAHRWFGAPTVAEQSAVAEAEAAEEREEAAKNTYRAKFERLRENQRKILDAEFDRRLITAAPPELKSESAKKDFLKGMWTTKVPMIGKNVFQQFMPEEASEAFAYYGEKKLGLAKKDVQKVWQDLIMAGEVKLAATAPEAPKKAPKGRTHTVNDFRFSRFDIKQEFAEGFDPDRIAVAFASDLARLGEFKVQSMNAPTYTAAAQ